LLGLCEIKIRSSNEFYYFIYKWKRHKASTARNKAIKCEYFMNIYLFIWFKKKCFNMNRYFMNIQLLKIMYDYHI